MATLDQHLDDGGDPYIERTSVAGIRYRVETTPAFFSEVAVLLMASAVVAYVCHLIRVTPIVSFLLAGALIGPQALGLVHDETLIEAAAEVGVILLLFTIGIEFSLEKLGRIQRLIFVGGGLQVGLTIGSITGVLLLFNVDWRSGVFTGFLVALSSTAIVMKLLMDRHATNTESGRASLGVLIFQDLAVVAMVLLVPMLSGEAGSSSSVATALGKAVLIIVLVLVAARRLMPRVLEAVARTCSQEIFLLTVVAICFGTAWLTSLAGVSLSLGAFLAGLVVSESRFSEMAFGEILPLQILFSATFFVSVGLLLDLRFLAAHPLLILAIIAGVLLVKILATGLSMKVLGYTSATSAAAGLMLAQVGEFSFVLERAGREVGLFPAGFADGGPQSFIAVTVLLMMATPFLSGLGDRFSVRRRREGPVTAEVAAEGPVLRDHVVIAGYGPGGPNIARALERAAIPYVILTLSPEGALVAEAGNQLVQRGNYMRRHELTRAGIMQARLLVVADDDPETAQRVVRSVRALNVDIQVIARTHLETEVPALVEAGASAVVADEHEGVARVINRILDAYDTGSDFALRNSSDRISPSTRAAMIELSNRQKQSQRCTHTEQADAVTPSAEGCEECLQMGDNWVHLRICMTCGHVGCCDASKNKHATKHHHASSHPIIKSFEAGEDWAWCYDDRVML